MVMPISNQHSILILWQRSSYLGQGFDLNGTTLNEEIYNLDTNEMPTNEPYLDQDISNMENCNGNIKSTHVIPTFKLPKSSIKIILIIDIIYDFNILDEDRNLMIIFRALET
ncbi:uncharacterized protein LOC113552570 [Rhopalosiphum maidis]|uniref:uncharacterized protein LOC113552570 n=1 Tax=Rhopalosiphum maidis TaxID=43146 RepID=UPI000EFF8E40|nr:uncharacterized protein LOC113552570 [Rhopalosiphum maidis]